MIIKRIRQRQISKSTKKAIVYEKKSSYGVIRKNMQGSSKLPKHKNAEHNTSFILQVNLRYINKFIL